MLGGKERLMNKDKDKEPEDTSEVEDKKFVSTDDLISKWYDSRGSGGWTGD
jgi:hypothetical protein